MDLLQIFSESAGYLYIFLPHVFMYLTNKTAILKHLL